MRQEAKEAPKVGSAVGLGKMAYICTVSDRYTVVSIAMRCKNGREVEKTYCSRLQVWCGENDVLFGRSNLMRSSFGGE